VLAHVTVHYILVTIPPGECLLVYNRFGPSAGAITILHAGTHFVNPLTHAILGSGPFEGLSKKRTCPVAMTRVSIDPPRTEIVTSDGTSVIPGHIDVAVEVQMMDWKGIVLFSHHTPNAMTNTKPRTL
jgi:hypothetical protein